MDEKKFDELFHKLTETSSEALRPELADKVKGHIPDSMPRHRGLDTINIMIDLRVSRLAAAAAIIIAVVLIAGFMGAGSSKGESLYQDAKLMFQYWLNGEKVQETAFQENSELLKRMMPEDTKDVEQFGSIIKPGDSESILMYWKGDDGQYEVIFGDFSKKTMNADELLKVQSDMLKKMILK